MYLVYIVLELCVGVGVCLSLFGNIWHWGILAYMHRELMISEY